MNTTSIPHPEDILAIADAIMEAGSGKKIKRQIRRHRPFAVLKDNGSRQVYYISVPKHLKNDVRATNLKTSGKIKVEIESNAQKLLAQFGNRLTRPRRITAGTGASPTVDLLLTQCIALGCSMTNEEIIQEKLNILNLLAQIRVAGCEDTAEKILQGKLEDLTSLSREKTLEEIREALAVSLEKDKDLKEGEESPGAKHIRGTKLPWKNKKLGEIRTLVEREEACEQVKTFLKEQYNFLTGKPWSRETRVKWASRFLQIVSHGIGCHLTSLNVNIFRKSLKFSKAELDPYIFDLEQLQEFMTYVRYWETEHYVALILCTWGCIRVEEVSRMRWNMIKLVAGAGEIKLSADITKTSEDRTIYEADAPHLFLLLRAVKELIGEGEGSVVKNSNWQNHLFFCFRELFGLPWLSNVMRSTGASMYLVHTDMPTCARIMGHLFYGIDRVLLRWYRKHVTKDHTERFMKMEPEPWSVELDARFKWKLYRGWTDCSRSTFMWPNYSAQSQHMVGMGSVVMTDRVRRKRPFFASTKGRSVEIELTHLDGTVEKSTIICRSVVRAKRMTHRIRVASYTGQGVINLQTGKVAHYERNYGPCLGQKLFLLTNGESLREQMETRHLGVKNVALAVGTSIDLLCRYFTMGSPENRTGFMPEKTKLKLEEMFTGLVFKPVGPPSDVMAWICRGADVAPTLSKLSAPVIPEKAPENTT